MTNYILGDYQIQSVKSTDFVVQTRILPIFNKYKEIITDDFWPRDKDKSDEDFKQLIDMHTPYFWACYDDKGECIGYIFLSHWMYGKFSCSMHIVIDEKYWGKIVLNSVKKFLDILFNTIGIYRMEALVPLYNTRCKALMKYAGMKTTVMKILLAIYGLTKEIYNGRK